MESENRKVYIVAYIKFDHLFLNTYSCDYLVHEGAEGIKHVLLVDCRVMLYLRWNIEESLDFFESFLFIFYLDKNIFSLSSLALRRCIVVVAI